MGLKPMHSALLAAAPEGWLSFADYMRIALYAPDCGYYSSQRQRVGRSSEADFYTATSLGSVFGQLIVASAVQLLEAVDPGEFTFVEIGAEPERTVLDGAEHPFKSVHIIRLGEPFTIPDKAVVFANELLDAQPFHRLRFHGGMWYELGVAIGTDSQGELTLTESLLPHPTSVIDRIIPKLPLQNPEGYTLDLSIGAETLLRELCSMPWKGALIFIDYGKIWADLLSSYPEGTLRAYSQQKQSNELYAMPGEQDLTGHVCWDRLEVILQENGFSSMGMERLEAFFMQHGRDAVARIIEAPATAHSTLQRQKLRELLHPAYLGTKFQVLWGMR